MDHHWPNPDRDRLGTLSALVLLTYTLSELVVLPTFEFSGSVFGLLIRLEINTRFVLLSLASALAMSGVDWIVRQHPGWESVRTRYAHWLIPGLAAPALGAILTRLPEGPGLVLGLILAAALLIAVMTAEFIVVDAHDPRYDLAASGLKILAMVLFIGIVFVLGAAGVRAIFSLPLIALSSFAVIWRLLSLAAPGWDNLPFALALGWINTQVALGLHYWPMPPLRSAFLLGLLVYCGVGLAQAQLVRDFDRTRLLEYGLVSIIGLWLSLTQT